MKKIKNKKGFTLIELIVVIAILAVLGLLLVPQISGYIKASKDAVGTANAKACYSSLAVKAANTEANLGIEVDTTGCIEVFEGTKLVGATWKDKDNKEYTYKAGVVTTPNP